MTTQIRTYSELRQYETFRDRFRYLSLHGSVGRSTFAFDRYINQQFYSSRAWRDVRRDVIARDLGCDLGVEGHEVQSQILVHHMNPMEMIDIAEGNPDIIDPEFLITTMLDTHNAIHFGDESLLPKPFVERRRGDTKLW